ncbi:MAG: alpha/beta hydrolase [Nocardioidaceae bacterium]
MRQTRGSGAALGAVLAGALLVACGTAQDIGVTGPTRTGDATTEPTPGLPSATGPTTPPTASIPPTQGLPQGFGQGPPGTGLARFYDQQVSWTPCGSPDTCASIWVPLDYDHPDDQAITIKAKLRPASNSAHPNGTLFINPGGPGASGIDYLGFIQLGASVTQDYDVVGFDPRGVGQSTPVHCLSDHDLDVYIAADPSPDTSSEVSVLQQQWEHFTRGCVENSGPLLGHVSTIEAARDMDILRAVVKDPSFNFYGASYGTYLGATYAAIFPAKVGRMVLDGAVDPEASPRASELAQTAGFQTALTAYLTDCVGSGSCPLGSSVDSAQQQLVSLFEQIDAKPLPTSSGRQLTEGLAFFGFILPLYSKDSWTYETQALEQALGGNGDLLLFLSDQYTDRQASGHYADNGIQVQPAVSCLDHPEHETISEIQAGASDFLDASPVFGQVATWFPYGCSNWPVSSTLPTPDYSAKGAPPIVVVGTTRDPATPYQQAVQLSHELDSGVLLSRDGDGHTAYSSGNVCIDTAIDTFLSAGTPPADGTMC